MSLWNHSTFANIESVYIIQKVMQNNWFEFEASFLNFWYRRPSSSHKKEKKICNKLSYASLSHSTKNKYLAIFVSFFHTHYFFSFLFVFGSCSLWNLSSPTPTPCSGPPEKSLFSFCWNILNQMINIMLFHCKYFSLDSTS